MDDPNTVANLLSPIKDLIDSFSQGQAANMVRTTEVISVLVSKVQALHHELDQTKQHSDLLFGILSDRLNALQANADSSREMLGLS